MKYKYQFIFYHYDRAYYGRIVETDSDEEYSNDILVLRAYGQLDTFSMETERGEIAFSKGILQQGILEMVIF